MGHVFWCNGSRFTEELAGLQAMAGTLGCGEATRNVRMGHGSYQRASEVTAVAGAGGRSQQVAVRAERPDLVLIWRRWLVTWPWKVVDGVEC